MQGAPVMVELETKKKTAKQAFKSTIPTTVKNHYEDHLRMVAVQSDDINIVEQKLPNRTSPIKRCFPSKVHCKAVPILPQKAKKVQ